MTTSFESVNAAARMRDIITQIARNEVRKATSQRYAEVVAVDTTRGRALVAYPDEPLAPFYAACGVLVPVHPGSRVRVAGPPGAPYVEEIYTTPGTGVVGLNTALRILGAAQEKLRLVVPDGSASFLSAYRFNQADRLGYLNFIDSGDFSVRLAAENGRGLALRAGASDRITINDAGVVDINAAALAIASALGVAIMRPGSPGRPFTGFYNTNGVTRYAAVVGADDGLELVSDVGSVKFLSGGSETARVSGSQVLVGKTAPNTNAVGAELAASGGVFATRSAADGALGLWNRQGSPASGEVFHQFQRNNTAVGNISLSGTANTSYGTSSDEALKGDVTAIEPAVAALVLRLIKPVWFRWLADPTFVACGYIAQQVAEAWPEAIGNGVVQPGVGTPDEHEAWLAEIEAAQLLGEQAYEAGLANAAALEAWSAECEAIVRWTPEGTEPQLPPEPELAPVPEVPTVEPISPWRPWMMDMGRLTPVVHAGWLYHDQRIAAQEKRIAALEAA